MMHLIYLSIKCNTTNSFHRTFTRRAFLIELESVAQFLRLHLKRKQMMHGTTSFKNKHNCVSVHGDEAEAEMSSFSLLINKSKNAKPQSFQVWKLTDRCRYCLLKLEWVHQSCRFFVKNVKIKKKIRLMTSFACRPICVRFLHAVNHVHWAQISNVERTFGAHPTWSHTREKFVRILQFENGHPSKVQHW